MDALMVVHSVVLMEIHWVVQMVERLDYLKVAWMENLKVVYSVEK